MQYALVDEKRSQAFKGAKGVCEQCKSKVIAKCGNVKLHHWAHEMMKDCDSWWEPETAWHRQWKNMFAEELREIPGKNTNTGEFHRADIQTTHKITIEFQHSRLAQDERASREDFYQDLVWVVDGTRLKKDFPRFLQGIKRVYKVSQDVYRTDHPEDCFPLEWIKSSAAVIFDFLGTAEIDNNKYRNPLYCLLPTRLGKSAIFKLISRGFLVESSTDGSWLPWLNNYLASIRQVNLEQENTRQAQATSPPRGPSRLGHNRRSRRL